MTGVKKTMGGRCDEVANFVTMEGENLSKNITLLGYVTSSTARGDVEDTGKDICSV